MRREFEPNRLAEEMLIQAYGQLVSLRVRAVERKEKIEPRPELRGKKEEAILVIGAITKEEVI